MIKITIEGAPGEGKTTTARLIFDTLKAMGANIEVDDADSTPEYHASAGLFRNVKPAMFAGRDITIEVKQSPRVERLED